LEDRRPANNPKRVESPGTVNTCQLKLVPREPMQPLFEEDPSERRSATRASLYLAASLYHDGHASAVKIRNISSAGALLDSPAVFTPGALVQLVRGSLIVHGLVAWATNGRYGLKFSGSIDVQQWRMAPANAEQQRIDDAVRLVKAGAVPLPVKLDSRDRPAAVESLWADLQRASNLLAKLGDRLARDGIVVAQYPTELQNLDIAMQVIAAVGAILSGQSDLASGAAKFVNLRKSADEAMLR
jgi:hypothetical protein